MSADGEGASRPSEPLSHFRLVATGDIELAQKQGSRLLSTYRLGVEEERRFNARVNGVSLGSVALYYLDFGDTRIDVASPPLDGFFGLILPVSGQMRLRYRGRELTIAANSSAAVISPDEELRMFWSSDFTSIVARIDKAALDSFAENFAPDARRGSGHFEPLVDSTTSLRSLRGVVDTLHAAVASTAATNGRLSAFPAARLREQLMTTLLLMQPNTYVQAIPTRPDDVSHAAVRQAVELIECESTARLTVAGLARELGVSPRTLQAGFQRDLDATPAGYMKKYRLERAREELSAGSVADGVTVADVANRWGFHHLGRFAAYYRERFAESPSATLHARRR